MNTVRQIRQQEQKPRGLVHAYLDRVHEATRYTHVDRHVELARVANDMADATYISGRSSDLQLSHGDAERVIAAIVEATGDWRLMLRLLLAESTRKREDRHTAQGIAQLEALAEALADPNSSRQR